MNRFQYYILTPHYIIQVENLDVDSQIEKAKQFLKADGKVTKENDKSLPHFVIDMNLDGVQLFNNTETMEFIPILLLVHSIYKSFGSDEPQKEIEPSYPAIIGFFHGKHKPPPKLLLKQLMTELKRLSPFNTDPLQTSGREFTLTLRCVRTDGPMRSYLKRIKGHSGYWSCERCIQKGERHEHKRKVPAKNKKETKTIQYRDLHAPLRRDEDFFSYVKDDGDCPTNCGTKNCHCQDEHLLNLNDISPFTEIENFPIISGFVIDPMHTLTAGAFGRKLEGIAHVPSEGKPDGASLGKINSRLELFSQCKPLEFDRHVRNFTACVCKYKHHELRQFLYYLLYPVFFDILPDAQLEQIMLLQKAMLLLGGFKKDPVSEDNIMEAIRLLKLYVKINIDLGYPVRFSTHESIHIPEDVAKFRCGVECLSAYVFENFQRFFRNMMRSGNLPVEQIRNRLIERSKYLLPTGSDGLIISTYQQFQIEAARLKMKDKNLNVVIEFQNNKGPNNSQIMRFPRFTLTNQFPDNVCILKSGSIVVVADIFETEKDVFLIAGFKFRQLKNIYDDPFPSSKFHTYIASKISVRPSEWNLNNIAGKIYITPHLKNTSNIVRTMPDIRSPINKWNVCPIFHTLY